MPRLPAKSNGQTLIEVVVVAGMVMLVLVALVSGVVMSIANNRISKDRGLATRYAQEGIEWLRGWRDKIGWQPLRDELADGVYCVNALPETVEGLQSLNPGDCGTNVISGTELSRSLEINAAGMGRFDYTSTISWQAGSKVQEVVLTGRLWKQQ